MDSETLRNLEAALAAAKRPPLALSITAGILLATALTAITLSDTDPASSLLLCLILVMSCIAVTLAYRTGSRHLPASILRRLAVLDVRHGDEGIPLRGLLQEQGFIDIRQLERFIATIQRPGQPHARAITKRCRDSSMS